LRSRRKLSTGSWSSASCLLNRVSNPEVSLCVGGRGQRELINSFGNKL
jgi:hypothetical protein